MWSFGITITAGAVVTVVLVVVDVIIGGRHGVCVDGGNGMVVVAVVDVVTTTVGLTGVSVDGGLQGACVGGGVHPQSISPPCLCIEPLIQYM